jgi:hypothetical protein
VSPIDLDFVPGLDTTAIRIALDRCYSAIVHENVLSMAVNSSTTSSREFEAGAAWKVAGILCNTCSGISCNLKETPLRCDQGGRSPAESAVTISASAS